MHLLADVLIGIGALGVLALGLFSVIRDLVERSPHEPPLIEDNGLAWPRRYQGRTPSSPDHAPAEERWAGDRERSHF
jgi:hypothetical protein